MIPSRHNQGRDMDQFAARAAELRASLPPLPADAPTYVYLLQGAQEPYIKIGISHDVATRAEMLRQPIDLSRSVQIACVTRDQAKAVETAVLAQFASQRSPRDNGGSGKTEWLPADTRDSVLAAIQGQLPGKPLEPVVDTLEPQFDAIRASMPVSEKAPIPLTLIGRTQGNTLLITCPPEHALKFKYTFWSRPVELDDGTKARDVWASKLLAAIDGGKVVVRDPQGRDASHVVSEAAEAWDKDLADRQAATAAKKAQAAKRIAELDAAYANRPPRSLRREADAER